MDVHKIQFPAGRVSEMLAAHDAGGRELQAALIAGACRSMIVSFSVSRLFEGASPKIAALGRELAAEACAITYRMALAGGVEEADLLAAIDAVRRDMTDAVARVTGPRL